MSNPSVHFLVGAAVLSRDTQTSPDPTHHQVVNTSHTSLLSSSNCPEHTAADMTIQLQVPHALTETPRVKHGIHYEQAVGLEPTSFNKTPLRFRSGRYQSHPSRLHFHQLHEH